MTSKICIRVMAALTCIALSATGWDAEAGGRRHHRQASCCCEPVSDPCCAPAWKPVCETRCAPACAQACEPVCVTRVVEPAGCCRTDWGYTVVQERVIVPAASCCDGRVVTAERPQAVADGDSARGMNESRQDGSAVRSVSATSRITQPASRR